MKRELTIVQEKCNKLITRAMLLPHHLSNEDSIITVAVQTTRPCRWLLLRQSSHCLSIDMQKSL